MPVIGFLGPSTPSAQREITDTFVQRLRELGWTEGRTVAIEYRWAEGRTERFAAITTEFVRLKVAVIVTQGTSIVIAAKQVTSDIPIVFASAGDPLGNGLVANLARPGGTSRACRVSQVIVLASDLSCCVSSFPTSIDWRC
jgi:putative ABC transport system substrate-binding protein